MTGAQAREDRDHHEPAGEPIAGTGHIVTLTPNPSVDRTLVVAHLTRGQVHRANDEHEEPSGKGVNVSRALTVNGVRSTAVLPLGGDAGLTLARLLQAEGVAFRAVTISGATRVNISVTESDGTSTKINAAGPELRPRDVAALMATLAAVVPAGGWVVASGSLPRGVADTFYADVADLVHQAGARYVLDSSGTALGSGLAGRPDVVKPNLDELREAVGRPLATIGEAVAAAHQLRERGAGAVVLSLGALGALLVDGSGVWHAHADAIEVSSTVGAGDALLAGFLAAGAAGPLAIAEGVAWGTGSVSRPGSLVPVITAAHRSAVRLTESPDPRSALRDVAHLG